MVSGEGRSGHEIMATIRYSPFCYSPPEEETWPKRTCSMSTGARSRRRSTMAPPRILSGMTIPPVMLRATDDSSVTLSEFPGRTVVFAYPRTGEPGKIALVDDWDMIPGARGCTPQSCSFPRSVRRVEGGRRQHVFGLSTQDNAYQTEMAGRLHLPFPGLVGCELALTNAMNLPTMECRR